MILAECKNKMLELDKFKTLVNIAPLVSIDFIVKNKDNKILLGKRVNKPAKDYYFTLGGRVFKNETLNEAKKRVLKDRIGLNIEDFNPKFIGVFEHFYNDSFVDIGFADELGSGVKNLYKYSKIYGGSDPLILEGEVFKIEVKTTQEIKKLSTKERILVELEKNNRLTRDDLAQLMGVSSETIKQHLSNLKKEGKLKRIGSTKSGYWKVINE